MSKYWVSGFGGQFDVRVVKDVFERALVVVKKLAEKNLREFDFRDYYSEVVEYGWFRKKESVKQLFAEKMPTAVEGAVRMGKDTTEAISKACLIRDDGLTSKIHWHDTKRAFDSKMSMFAHMKKIKGIIEGLKNCSTELTSIHMTDEAFEYYNDLVTLLNNEEERNVNN